MLISLRLLNFIKIVFTFFAFDFLFCKLNKKNNKELTLNDNCANEFFENCRNECKRKNMDVCFCKDYNFSNEILQKCVCLKDKEDCEKELKLFYNK